MEFIKKQLKDLEEKGLKRQLKNVVGMQGRELIIDGRLVLNFCSNNYLGLADDLRMRFACSDSLFEEGVGSAASRLVCGNMAAHRALEKKLAEFKGTQSALVFSTGYMANVGIISSLFDRHDIIFSDKLNHASIVDGVLLSRATFKRYPHKDMSALEELLKQSQGFKKKAIITDSVFSMDGDVAPLKEIVSLAKKYDCLTMVDEAHGFGILGKHGKGAVEYFGLEEDIDIQMGTLSKAAGAFGAYCCGSEDLTDYLINHTRSFIYTTGMPPSVAVAAAKAIEIIEKEPWHRLQLHDYSHYLRHEITAMGFNTLESQTPIIPIIVGDARKAVEFSKKLFEKGVFVQAIRPPTVPEGTARLRLTVMSSHRQSDLDILLQALKTIGKDLCLI